MHLDRIRGGSNIYLTSGCEFTHITAQKEGEKHE